MIRSFLSVFILLTALLSAGCTPAQRAVDCQDNSYFCLNLSYANEEQSEDTNSTTETLNIVGHDVLYTWTYDGYHPDDEFERIREVSFTLTDDDYEALLNLIQGSELLTSVEETQTLSANGAMASHSVNMRLDLTLEFQATHITIVGLTDIYMGNGESTSNIKNGTALADVERVLSFIQNAEGFEAE